MNWILGSPFPRPLFAPDASAAADHLPHAFQEEGSYHVVGLSVDDEGSIRRVLVNFGDITV